MNVRRIAPVDQLSRDDELLVLLDGQAVRVAGLAPAILEFCEHWTSTTQVTEELVRRFGAPPGIDVDALVTTAIDDLVESGLVETRD